jgi:deoxyribodipyrimidine photo-lyase
VLDARITKRKDVAPDPQGQCVLYWMQRSQRGIDNHALDVTVREANRLKLPVVVYFAPVPFYPHANLRHYTFLQQGIADIERDVNDRNCGFVLRRYPDHSLMRFIAEVQPALLIADENPMREPEHWRQVVAKRIKIPFWTVDADVVVPTSIFAKEQFAAHTIRPRILRALDTCLVPFANAKAEVGWKPPKTLRSLPIDTDITAAWKLDRTVAPVNTFRGGTREALRLLQDFVERKLHRYSRDRNHPELEGTSRLSPYLHFGQIGPVTVALAAQASGAPKAEIDSFLDELVTWRELSINFVKFNPDYDSIENADRWARESLAEHARDEREHLYSEAQLETGDTHDPLWNAAHLQMVRGGWMHNYMRMYWAKKILEWTRTPAHAYNIAVRLNDKYELDGRDPNGYGGVAWAIAGKHDRAWFTRPILGKVRYMSARAAAKKFDTRKYIEQVLGAEQERLL